MNNEKVSPFPETDRKLIIDQIRKACAQITYTHKTHEVQADIYRRLHQRQKHTKIVLTVLSSGTFLASLTGFLVGEEVALLVTSFIAVLLTGATLNDKTFKYGENMQLHHGITSKLWGMQESYVSLLVDLNSHRCSPDEARDKRDSFQKELGKIQEKAPQTTLKAQIRAKKELGFSSTVKFSDREIDNILPSRLRTGY